MFSKSEVQNELATTLVGRKMFMFEDIDSTNACARVLAEAGTEEGAVICADYQTAGRGRQGRSWHAERGVSLLFSLILRPTLPLTQYGFLPLFAATSIAAAVEECTGLSVDCKWPNDLLLRGKKFCGILVENNPGPPGSAYVVIGAGVNVNQRSFPEEVRDRATSLALELHRTLHRVHLLRIILTHLDHSYAELSTKGPDTVRREWTQHSRMLGGPVSVQSGTTCIEGTAVRLADDGGLVIAEGKTEHTVYAGDVTVLL